METIYLQGSALERGQQIGERFRPVIRDHAQRFKEPEGWPRYRYGDAAARHLFFMLEHAPAFVEEIRGIGIGAGVGFRAAFQLTATVALLRAQDPNDCTNFAADTIDAGPMLGKTEDMGARPLEELAQFYIIQQVKPDNGYRYLAATPRFALWTATGINEHGLAVGTSSGPSQRGVQDGSGIHYLGFPRLILEQCRTVEEGAQLLGRLRMAGKGILFMLVDASGAMAAVEKWHDQHAVRTATDGGLFFANAFLSPEMRDLLPPRGDRENAAHRVATLDSRFQAARRTGGYTSRFMAETLAGHAPAGSICRHGTGSPADGGATTGAAFLFRCRDARMAAYAGPPCGAAPQWMSVNF